MSRDVRLILAAQALRAFAYGAGAVLLGVTLDQSGFSSTEVGAVLASVVAGTVLASIAIGRFADRWTRRRCYAGLYGALGLVGVAYATTDRLWLLVLAGLTGAMSTEVVESGPFTSLEQAMLATDGTGRDLMRHFSVYNAVATAAGSLGALAAGGVGPLRHAWPHAPRDQAIFWVFVPVALVGVAIASHLSAAIEPRPAPSREARPSSTLARSRPAVLRLSALFAADSFGGGFVVQAFLAYWLSTKFGASVATLGVVFFMVGVLQTLSMLAAPRVAARVGLLSTMVFTHLPSNVLLIAIAFAPNLPIAVALLLGRVVLSQMDVPTRQAYVMALVDPDEQTAAAAYTNTARYVVRPAGPALAGASQALALGAPFVIGGAIKSFYDVVLWRWFRTVDVPLDAVRLSTAKPATEPREVSA